MLQLPFGLLLGSVFHRTMGAPYAALCALAAVFVLNFPLLRRLALWWLNDRQSPLYVWLVDTPFYIHFIASLLFGPLSYLALLAVLTGWLTGWLRPAPPVMHYLGPLYLGAAVVGTYATLIRRFWTVIQKTDVPIRNLPEALQGYTLMQLSDIHCGPYAPRRWYRALARRATALRPDAIVITGDCIAGGTAYLADVSDFVRALSARDGVYGSMGNHDYYGTADGVQGAMRAGGATVLLNRGVVLAGDRGGIYLAALDDDWSERDDLTAALADRPAGLPCILLAHDPAMFPMIAARGDIDLVLSGHTHGGQLAVPFAYKRWNLARIRGPHTSGIYQIGRTLLYVHRGNGTSGPPARLGAAPEIALLVLRRAAES